ncbi:MAG: HEAT repeat domain-containing protein [Pirellulaceae bacterium]
MTLFAHPWPFALKIVAATCALGIVALSLAAQDPPAGKGADEDPFGKKAPGDKGAKEGPEVKTTFDRTRIQGLLNQDPLILRHLRESSPTTPDQLMMAAEITLKVESFAECKAYLKKFLEAKPDDATMAGIAARRGSEILLRLSRHKDVQPEGKQVAMAVLTAADKVVKDPARIDRLIVELGNPDAGKRDIAANDLAQAGVYAVVPLITALGDPARAKDLPALQNELVRLKVVSEGPLLAALDSADEAQRVNAISTLGYLDSKQAVPHLVRPAVDPKSSEAIRKVAKEALMRLVNTVPTAADAEKYLHRRLIAFLAAADVLSQDLGDVVEIWKWDAGQKIPVPLMLPKSDANLLLASRLAEDLHAIAPKDQYLRLRVMTRLETDKIVGGLDKPLPRGAGSGFELASEAGEDTMNEVLSEAVKQNRLAAAIAACEVLGEMGHARLLLAAPGQESPLARLLLHPDHRLRFAAAMAIVKLNPTVSFPGASHVTDTLAYYASTSGSRRVLVGHPRADDGQTLVGYMNEIDYEAEAAYTGKALMQFAVASPDYDFILISDAIDSPGVTELVQQLRKDFRTARLPIGVMARGERLDKMKDAFEDDTLTTVFPRIHDSETAGYEVSRLVALASRNLMTPDERVDQAAAALDALAFLADRAETQPVYDLVRHETSVIRALTAPGLSAEAAKVLGRLATPKCQTALVDFISQHGRPLEDRQAAAAAFDAAVARRGTLLTKAQILLQYDRYNGSATLDPETQAVLGRVLDTLESKKQK